MDWTRYHKFLALMLVITGSMNTLSMSWADKITARGSDGIERLFEHPFLQGCAMFLGETLCLFVYKIIVYLYKDDHPLTQGDPNFNPWILFPAAMFDLIGTSIMYIGLTLTYPSSFQMFRGSIIVFVAMMSMTLLNRTIDKREWGGIVLIIIGLVVVGATDAIYMTAGESKGRNSLITGDLLIIAAQIVSACQMVYEEKYVAGLNIPPLQAVGWEGVFGFSVLSLLLVVFYWIPAPPHFGHNARGTIEDAIDGFVQIGNNVFLLISLLGTIISIAFFNFAGISVTKEMSATTRMVLDSIRTFVIWMVSLAVRWQIFHWQHLVGFTVLIIGMAQYNGLIPVFRWSWCRDYSVDESDSDSETEVVNTTADADAEA